MPRQKRFQSGTLIACTIVLGLLGCLLLIRVKAGTPTASFEAETGSVGSPATVVASQTASGGKAVRFGGTQTTSGSVIEDWSADWQKRWFIGNGGTLDKIQQQGLRLADNVVVVNDGGRNVVRIYVRRSDQPYTVSGTTIPAGSWSAGLMQERPPYQYKYGKWEFDFKATPGRGSRVVALLWPGDGSPSWPAGGELDAPEMGDNNADRLTDTITNHWANASGGNAQKVVTVSQDFTQWVHVTYRWSANRLEVDYNGRQVAVFTDNLPPDIMKLCLQTAVAKGGWADTFVDSSGKTVVRQESYMEVGPITYSADPNS
jgi:hypothetical protein